MDKKVKGIVVGASLGVLAGAIAGILLAPKSGKETRTDIVNYLHEMKDEITDEINKVGKVSREAYNGIVEKIVKVYELEKKITAEDAKDIQAKLDKNYDKVMEVLEAKKDAEAKKTSKK